MRSTRFSIALLAALAGVLAPGGPRGLGAAAPPTRPAASAPAPPLEPPGAESFRAYDRSSDDGSAIIVEWAKPAKPVKGIRYVVEIARSEADFAAGRFKTQVVEPSARALKAAQPKYFGFSKDNESRHFAAVVPAKRFPPADLPKLTAERLRQLVGEGVLNQAQCDRAVAALRSRKVPGEPSPAEGADRKWLQRLEGYLGGRLKKARKDEQDRINAATYHFRLAVTDGTRKVYVSRDGQAVTLKARARANYFKLFKLNNLIFAVLFSGTVLTFIRMARRNPNLFIRRIPGLEAVDEAIGRAAEMGRRVYFVHGLTDMDSLATIAAVTILARVARRCAEFDVRIRVMNNRPIVTAVSQEVVQQACIEAGRPDAFDPDDVSLVATDQFSYVAAVAGLMIRERPAAVFMLGYFYAESLLLAETGASTGAIQVAGTDAYTQLPFFVTTCDYTLIGEELFAASAYLSREPRMLGSLRGQDVGKAFLMIAMVLGAAAMTAATFLKADTSWLRSVFVAMGG